MIHFKYMEISYVSKSPAKEYARSIRKAKTKEELVKNLERFERVAPDALACAKAFTDEDFSDLVRDLPKAKKEQPKKWIEEFNRRFGDIALPYKLMISEIVADNFHCPWGCAFIRCEEIGWDKVGKGK